MTVVYTAVCISIFILLAGERSVGKASAESSTTVTLSPTPASIIGWNTVQVQIMANDVENLYGADVRLSFDPTMLEVMDDLPDPSEKINIQPEDTFLDNLWVIRNEADNTAGTIWYAVIQLSPATPKSGSGALATIHFKVKKPGTSAISFTYKKLVDMHGNGIPATSTNGSVQIRLQFLPLVTR